MGRKSSDSHLQAREEGGVMKESTNLVEQTCRWNNASLRHVEACLSTKNITQNPEGVRLLLGEDPPSRICKRGKMNGGGGRYSRKTCGRSRRYRQRREMKKKKQNELAISSRARPVTHLTGPPTSRVPPSYVAPIQQRKASPHPSEEGRGL